MAKVENFNVPSGWLIDPHNKWAIHFDVKQDSNNNNDSSGDIESSIIEKIQ